MEKLTHFIRSSQKHYFPFLLWGIFLLAPFFLHGWALEQIAHHTLYGVLAMSLALIWGRAGILCFGQAIFFGLGAYSMAVISLASSLPYASFLGLVGSAAIPAFFAFLVGLFLFYNKPRRGKLFHSTPRHILSGAAIAMITLSLGIMCERLITQINFLGGANGLGNIPELQWGAKTIDSSKIIFWINGFTAFIFYSLFYVILSKRWGLILKAISQNEHRLQELGYDPSFYKIFLFVLAGACAGVAGGLLATQLNFVSADLTGLALSSEVLIWVAIAGRHNIILVFITTLLLLFLESVLQDKIGSLWLLCLGGTFMLRVLIHPVGKGFFLMPKWPIRQDMATKHKDNKSSKEAKV